MLSIATAPIIKSLALVVVLDAVAGEPLPVLVIAEPSNVDDVSAPLTPNATAAPFVPELHVIVIVVWPLAAFTAYQVSNLTLLVRTALCVHDMPDEVTLLTVTPVPSEIDRYTMSFAEVVVRVRERIVCDPLVPAEAEPSIASGVGAGVGVGVGVGAPVGDGVGVGATT